MKPHIFIIEHLEPVLGKWTFIEYKNISKIVGKNNLLLTNIKKASDTKKLKKYAITDKKSVKTLNLKNSCILDPESKKTLAPKIAKQFKYFIFGGILGDMPAKKRTEKELTLYLNCPAFNIGKKQMPTDNAVAVVKGIINGNSISKMKFQDSLEIIKDKRRKIQESFILPYRYLLKNNNPLISPYIISYLKKKRGF